MSFVTDTLPTFVKTGARGNDWGPIRRILQVVAGTNGAVFKIRSNAKAKGADAKQSDCHPIMMGWGRDMLDVLAIDLKVIGPPPERKACLFLGNHASYLDIPLLMSLSPVVFIGKKQLASWPLFGDAMRSVGTVFVDRDCRESRKNAADAVAPRIANDGQSVAIFPSGTTTVDEQKPWRWGAFVIAKRYGFPIQPFRIRYGSNPEQMRTAAYIGSDLFVSHLWKLASLREGMQASIEFAEPMLVNDPQEDAHRLWKWCREGL